MRRRVLRVVGWSGLVLLLLVAGAGRHLLRLAGVGAAYHAKILCSAVFVSGREPAAVLAADLAAEGLELLAGFEARVDREARSVRSSLAGLVEREAVFRPGLGCGLVLEGVRPPDAPPMPACGSAIAALWPWPEGDGPAPEAAHPEVDSARLEAALRAALAEPDPARPRRTRAVLVAHRGRLLGERYAPGFGPGTPLLGWSMTKSVLAALVGVLVGQGRLQLGAGVPVAGWEAPGDARAAIRLEDLLRMQGGLEFEEVYSSPLADATWMLLGVPDAAAFAADKPLARPPGSAWSYSSGTSNILAGVVRRVVGEAEHLTFPRRALFAPLGMCSAVLETDPAGTFVGSSYMYATARDWARFGELLRLDGVWRGRRVLPEGWVGFLRSPTRSAAERGRGYGAHVWLEVPPDYRGAAARGDLPADAFHLVGHEGQLVSILPSRELVVVRLGLTYAPHAWDHEAFLAEVLAALPAGEGPASGAQAR